MILKNDGKKEKPGLVRRTNWFLVCCSKLLNKAFNSACILVPYKNSND